MPTKHVSYSHPIWTDDFIGQFIETDTVVEFHLFVKKIDLDKKTENAVNLARAIYNSILEKIASSSGLYGVHATVTEGEKRRKPKKTMPDNYGWETIVSVGEEERVITIKTNVGEGTVVATSLGLDSGLMMAATCSHNK